MVKTIINGAKKEQLGSIHKTHEDAALIFVRFKGFKDSANKYNRYLKKDTKELERLAISAGANVDSITVFNQVKPNPKYFISKGKLEQVKSIVLEKGIDLVIFSEELTPAQQTNIQEKLNTKVIDKTALILDIFAQRAHSREGKLQVELAQLNYILPRLSGKGVQLSRLGGGIGTRGPGETKLEVDRRKIRDRIRQLEKKINKIGIQREVQRKKRKENNIFQVSLVGYTNSGKSTLLNTITNSNVYTKDMLFSTLDSTTRRLKISTGQELLISDTVGFIEKLPHQLIASFKSTLDEVRNCDLLLLIVDISDVNFENHILSVKKVLKEIDVYHKPIFLIFNKIDKVDESKFKEIRIKYKNAIFISALKKIGIGDIYYKIKKIIEKHFLSINVKIPYNKNKLTSFIYDNCQVIKKQYFEDGILLLIKADSRHYSKLSKYIWKK